MYGILPGLRRKRDQLGGFQPTATVAVAQLIASGEVLGLETKTTYAETTMEGCSWSEWLTFCVKVCRTTKPLTTDSGTSVLI